MTSTTTTASDSPQIAPKRDDAGWIRDELIPALAADGKFARSPADGGRQRVQRLELQRLSLTESFMLTICYKIEVTVRRDADDARPEDDWSVRLVVKITPDVGEEMLRLMCFQQLFHNEVTAYGTIFPALGWSDDFPKCYYSHIRPDGCAIVLADFTVDGWRMSRAKFNLSLEHILVAVTELGKFHGSLYGLKHTDPAKFRSLCSELQESRYVFDGTAEQWDRRLRIGPKRSTAAVRALGEKSTVPERFLQRLELVLEDTFAYMKRVTLRAEEPMAILCHGDFLRNNIAYKYISETSDVPESVLLFDFQTLRYTSPMIDLVTFMVNSTGCEVRRQHFDHIFAAYHTALCFHFQRTTGIQQDAAEFPAFLGADVFLREYALYLPLGLAIGGSFLPVLHVPDETPFDEFDKRTEEFEREDAWKRGGEPLDAELRAIVAEMYALYDRLGLQLDEKF